MLVADRKLKSLRTGSGRPQGVYVLLPLYQSESLVFERLNTGTLIRGMNDHIEATIMGDYKEHDTTVTVHTQQ